MNNQRIWAVVVAILALVGLASVIAFNVGVHRGIEQSGKVVMPQGGSPAYPYPYPYAHYGWHPWGPGFFFAPLFFFLLFFLVIRGLFWRGGWHRHGWGPHAFEEWHRHEHERMDNRPE